MALGVVSIGIGSCAYRVCRTIDVPGDPIPVVWVYLVCVGAMIWEAPMILSIRCWKMPVTVGR